MLCFFSTSITEPSHWKGYLLITAHVLTCILQINLVYIF